MSTRRCRYAIGPREHGCSIDCARPFGLTGVANTLNPHDTDRSGTIRFVKAGRFSRIVIGRLLSAPPWGWLLRQIHGERYAKRLRGATMSVDRAEISYQTRAKIFWGLYERAEREMVRMHLRTDLDVIELGASLGAVGMEIAARLQGAARYIGVEPNPDLITALSSNVANAAGDTTTIFLTVAVDATPTVGPTLLYRGSSTAGSSLHAPTGFVRPVAVETVSLHALLRQLTVEKFTLVCDIEGSEAPLLLLEHESLRRCEQLIIELHDTTYCGEPYSVDRLRHIITDTHGFTEEDDHWPVFVFSRIPHARCSTSSR